MAAIPPTIAKQLAEARDELAEQTDIYDLQSQVNSLFKDTQHSYSIQHFFDSSSIIDTLRQRVTDLTASRKEETDESSFEAISKTDKSERKKGLTSAKELLTKLKSISPTNANTTSLIEKTKKQIELLKRSLNADSSPTALRDQLQELKDNLKQTESTLLRKEGDLLFFQSPASLDKYTLLTKPLENVGQLLKNEQYEILKRQGSFIYLFAADTTKAKDSARLTEINKEYRFCQQVLTHQNKDKGPLMIAKLTKQVEQLRTEVRDLKEKEATLTAKIPAEKIPAEKIPDEATKKRARATAATGAATAIVTGVGATLLGGFAVSTGVGSGLMFGTAAASCVWNLLPSRFTKL